jgi:hypothetical protein
MDEPTRALLTTIREALDSGPDFQRFRIAAALDTLLMPDTTATLEWATDFIRNPPGEEADQPEYSRPPNP